jgi:hypothetical protein
MNKMLIDSILQQRVLTLLLLSTLLATTGLAHAEENLHHHHMQHESHSQHHLSNVQRGHINHVHEAGSWMFEYRFMRMEMDEMLAGSSNVLATDVAKIGSPYKNTSGGDYMMAPTDMTMDMHMLMGMYSQSDNLSWMLMLNYLDNKMNMVARSGARLAMKSSGIGDLKISTTYKLYDKEGAQLLTNLELSLPTGSIKEANNQGMLPYAMQLGSGTYDLIPSLTYRNNYGRWNWGLQGSYTFRLNRNSQNYALGDSFDGQVWIKMNPLKNTSVTGRVTFSDWKSIIGSANGITMMQRNMSPTFDAINSGGNRWDASIGISQMFESGHMLGIGYGVPIQQKLDGLQMKTKQIYTISWQYLF